MRLTFEDDVSTVQQFKQFFTVIPGLMRIKLLQMRGAYSVREGGAAASEKRGAEPDSRAPSIWRRNS